MNEWTRVKDRLPQESKTFIVVIDGKTTAAFYDLKLTKFWYICGILPYATTSDRVEFWSEIPDPPNSL